MTVIRKSVLALAGIAAIGAGFAATPSFAELGMGGMRGGMGGMMPDFATLDADKDGKVTQAEIDAARQARVTALDTNADGNISAEELVANHMANAQARAQDMATRMIENRDANGDGVLSAAEMMTPAMPDRMFSRLDTDGDGAISEAEMTAARDLMAEMRDGGRRGKGHGNHGGRGHGFWQDMMGGESEASPAEPAAPAPAPTE